MKKTLFVAFFAFILIFTGCVKIPAVYSISVFINGANFGTVEDVSGDYVEGTNVTIKAKANSKEQPFFCWLHENRVASTDAEYTFEVNKETSGSYIALFNCPDLEYFYLDNFTFNNKVPSSSDNTQYVLKEISLNFGYNQKELVNVYTCTDEELLNMDVFEGLNEKINESKLPFAFNKTKTVYINFVAKYKTITEDVELDYESNTTFILNKSENISADSTLNQIENQILNLTKNIENENLPPLELEDEQSSISLNFKKLVEFEFSTEEDEGEETPA